METKILKFQREFNEKMLELISKLGGRVKRLEDESARKENSRQAKS